MADRKNDPAPADRFTDRDRAPLVFFDQSPTGAYSSGIVSLTLSADVFATSGEGAVSTEHAIVAHLKTSVQGARSLRAMLDKALLLAEPTSGGAN